MQEFILQDFIRERETFWQSDQSKSMFKTKECFVITLICNAHIRVSINLLELVFHKEIRMIQFSPIILENYKRLSIIQHSVLFDTLFKYFFITFVDLKEKSYIPRNSVYV